MIHALLAIREMIEAEGGSEFGDVVSELHDVLSALQGAGRVALYIESGELFEDNFSTLYNQRS